MKKIFLFIALITVISAQLMFAQNNRSPRFSKPLYSTEESSRNPIGPPISVGEYPYFQYPYVNYDISNDSTPQNEPSIKFSGKFPNIVVGAWRDFRTTINQSDPIRRVGYSYSTNAGTSWSVSALTPITDPSHPRTSDAVVCSDTAGNFYIATISIDITNGNGEVLIYKSTDGGITFPVGYIAAGGNGNNEDKEWIACDLTHGSSPYKNNLYISWTRFGTPNGILFMKSSNGGVNWASPFLISHESGVQGSDLTIGPNGDIYVIWLGGFSDDIIYFNKSTNGGTSFQTTDVIAGEGATPNVPFSQNGYLTFPSIATDISGGPRNGNIYVTWCDARNGDPDIFLSRSTNGGTNFSTAVRVNNDAVSNGKLQCWPWISVNETGNIAILYYDSRNTANNNIIEAWLARSTDGGITFVNEKLSSVPSPTNQPNTAVRYGDYINVDYKGTRIVPIWTDVHSNY
jgi:hypothetical protein